MWLFFSDGFLSIVAHRDLPDYLLVRTRNMSHLKDLFPKAEHFTLLNSDYPHRAIIPRKVACDMITNYMMSMKYDNFKKSVPDKHFKDACNMIWSIMYQYGVSYRRGY